MNTLTLEQGWAVVMLVSPIVIIVLFVVIALTSWRNGKRG